MTGSFFLLQILRFAQNDTIQNDRITKRPDAYLCQGDGIGNRTRKLRYDRQWPGGQHLISRLPSGLYRRYRNLTGSVPRKEESRTIPPVGNCTLP